MSARWPSIASMSLGAALGLAPLTSVACVDSITVAELRELPSADGQAAIPSFVDAGDTSRDAAGELEPISDPVGDAASED